MLTNKDAIKIYNAIAYAMRQGVFAGHPHHHHLADDGLGCSGWCGCVLGRYLNEARKWLPAERGPRGVQSARSVLTKTELRYVYVHENAPNREFSYATY